MKTYFLAPRQGSHVRRVQTESETPASLKVIRNIVTGGTYTENVRRVSMGGTLHGSFIEAQTRLIELREKVVLFLESELTEAKRKLHKAQTQQQTDVCDY